MPRLVGRILCLALSLTLRPLSVPLRLSGNKARNKKKREREKKRKHKLAAELVELRKGNSPEKKHKPVKSPASDTLVGRDQAWLTSRHDAKGKHTGRASKDLFITVGKDTALVSAVHAVYGEHLCEAALCSRKGGPVRMAACDRAEEEDHSSVNSAAHQGNQANSCEIREMNFACAIHLN